MDLFILIISIILTIILSTITIFLLLDVLKQKPTLRIPHHINMLVFAFFLLFSMLSFNYVMNVAKEYAKDLECGKIDSNFEVLFERDSTDTTYIKINKINEYIEINNNLIENK